MKKVIAVLGPTAVGKTKISIMLAKHYNLDIISGDSVSVYKGLDIGSAKPTLDEMDNVKHYLIDIRNPLDTYSVCDFQTDARKIIDKNELSLICGGTGLYIKACLCNYEFDDKKRDLSFEDKYKDLSNEQLYELLLKLDNNIDKEKLHPNNRKRVLRALEVKLNTNKSIHLNNKKDEYIYDYYIVYLSMDRVKLYDRINKRVDKMIEDGLIEEVKNLYDKGIYPHAIGYQEFIPYFKGECTLDSAIDEIKKNTRHLAKRQETWFKNQMNSHFYEVNLDDIENTYNKIVKDIDEWL
ncbi:MAG: tRNA (adenosine(37)-N6)-dimethylallyltransferase MiaA [Acholeplasmatales bacterium]|nr:tRNA (adenosine(37)-N6)-dimethylallyltransferase MiaA [Acholeplasmatales bacterium]